MTLPKSAAEAHLREHSDRDSVGECKAPTPVPTFSTRGEFKGINGRRLRDSDWITIRDAGIKLVFTSLTSNQPPIEVTPEWQSWTVSLPAGSYSLTVTGPRLRILSKPQRYKFKLGTAKGENKNMTGLHFAVKLKPKSGDDA